MRPGRKPAPKRTYVCLMYKRKLACFTKAELKKALNRSKKMEARAEKKVKKYLS